MVDWWIGRKSIGSKRVERRRVERERVSVSVTCKTRKARRKPARGSTRANKQSKVSQVDEAAAGGRAASQLQVQKTETEGGKAEMI